MARYTESFNTANSTTLGPDLSWTETNGDLQIVTNRVGIVSTGVSNRARADSDMATDDNYAQITIVDADTTSTNRWGVACRFSSSADTCYVAFHGDGASVNNTLLQTVEAGTVTEQSTGTHTKATNDVLRIEAIGSQIIFYINGVANITVTSTAITTGKRGGIGLRANTTGLVFLDNFVTGDLALASGHGDIANTGQAPATVAFVVDGHGDVATVGTGSTVLDTVVDGHGDHAVTGITSAVNDLMVDGHGDIATVGAAPSVLDTIIDGHGDLSVLGTAATILDLIVAGHGDTAITGTGSNTLDATITGHGDIAVTGTGDATLTLGQAIAALIRYQLGKRRAVATRSRGIRS